MLANGLGLASGGNGTDAAARTVPASLHCCLRLADKPRSISPSIWPTLAFSISTTSR